MMEIVKRLPNGNQSVKESLEEALSKADEWDGVVILALNKGQTLEMKRVNLDNGEANWMLDSAKFNMMQGTF